MQYRVAPTSSWSWVWKVSGATGLAGLVVAGLLGWADPTRFAFAYLFAFFVALSLALGNLFFVMLLYVTRANWGITVRRVAELFMRPMALFAVLAIPLVVSIPRLFPWAGAHRDGTVVVDAGSKPRQASSVPLALDQARGEAEREPVGLRRLPVADRQRMDSAERSFEAKLVDHKRPYLNPVFFLIRFVLYLAVWQWLARRYFRWSTAQDRSRALNLTRAAQDFAPVGLILFGLTTTFFGFDWLLSLDATWYSTMFGVYVFAQCALVQMATLILVTLAMRRSGLLGDAVTVEHYHDMGKLLFGWISFWAYIAFAQFFLIWYSNIPDEVMWFHKRWDEAGMSWRGISVSLAVLHFFLPFWFLISRNIKRRLPFLAAGAVCMVVMHVVEVYWVVMPNLGDLAPKLVDAACLVGVVGVYLSSVLRGMKDVSLVAVGDPRLPRALEFENA
jgi:hypothetical protein